MASRHPGGNIFLGANSSRPTSSFRQRPKKAKHKIRWIGIKKTRESLDGCRALFHTGEPCVASPN
jgi:hypothetical protein